MLEIEIDGKKVEVPDGSTVMDAANKSGTYIPHFCYHKKLSIAASCRMCLVEVEKAPKPLPACATPVTNGMKVLTHSDKSVKAQKGVMEFLLINHPLDCPICDQGGECQLQDLAVGYGSSASRYAEEKRVVVNKNLGPLIATDMTRCIHCTRCVRFGQEIAGIMELGVANRGELSEIMTFVDRTVDSELSGNAIDLCPVGALTSKPFRFSARTWEMSRRRSISPHDSLGANLVVQTKHDQVKRVLPLENESLNECWLSDKDRFSYEALASDDRLTQPMIKQGGQWIATDWQSALEYAAKGLRGVIADHGATAVGALVSPHATLEEQYLTQALMRGLGSDNVDFRLRQSDFSADGARAGIPSLGMPVAEIGKLDRVLVIGSFLRKDHPLLAQRLRQGAKRGSQVSLIGFSADDQLMPLQANIAVAPSAIVGQLAALAGELAALRGVSLDAAITALAAESTDDIRALAASLVGGESRAILIGNAAVQHPVFASLWTIAQAIADCVGARLGFIGEAAGSVGGYVAKAVPQTGLNAAAMMSADLKAYVLVGVEPTLDLANGAAAASALAKAETVVALTAFRSAVEAHADVMLPIGPFCETSGTYVNCEGLPQSFHAATKPLGEARPAWKVLRVLGNLLELDDFHFETSEAVRDAALGGGIDSALSNRLAAVALAAPVANTGIERVADVPIHFADPLVRRAASLQKTRDARVPALRANAATLQRLGLEIGGRARIKMEGVGVELAVEVDAGVPEACVRIAVAHALTAALGPMFGNLVVERI